MAKAIVRNRDEGDRRWFLGGGLHVWKATAEETGGSMIVYEDLLDRGKVTPLHFHADVDEAMYVIEGEVRVRGAEGDEQVVSTGGFFFAPRGCTHAFVVTSDRARVLAIQTPGTAEDFYLKASEPIGDVEEGTVDFDRIRDAAVETGATTIVGPPPFAVSTP